MKIFFLTPRIPYPIDKGDKLRAFYQIKYLSKNHEIFLFSFDEQRKYKPNQNPLLNYCKGIVVKPLSKIKIVINLLRKLFSPVPFQTAYYYDPKIKKEIEECIKNFKPDILICQLIRTAEYVKNIKNIPKVIDYIDAISKGLERRIFSSNFFMKIILMIEFNRVKQYEKKLYEEFDNSLIISYQDRDSLFFEGKEKIKVIPNGIDLNYFYPIEYPKEYDLFFSGNLNYPPNIDASEFIVKKILPLLLNSKPDIKVLIAGASPSKKILSLDSKNVDVKGWIEDIRDYYKRAKVFVAPMQLGTGLQNKLLQAMAMKVPCVVSELAANALKNNAKDAVLVAKTPEEYSEKILLLLNDEKFRLNLAQKGYEFVMRYYDWNNIINELELFIYETKNKFKSLNN